MPAKAPHPAAAWTVKLTALVPAVPAGAAGPSNSQEGSDPVDTVNGVPPLAAEVTETILGAPGTYTGPVELYAHVIVTGAAASADVVAVSVAVTVAVTSLTTEPGAPEPTVV